MSNSCNPLDCSPPGSSVHGILQARILGWVAISFSKGSSQSRDQTQDSCIAGKFFTDWATRETWIWAHPIITGSQQQFGSNDPCYPGPPHALKSIQPLLWSPLHSSAHGKLSFLWISHCACSPSQGEAKNVCPDWISPGISSPCLCWSRFDSQTHSTDCEIEKLSYETQLGCGSGKGNLTVTFVNAALYG